MRKKLLSLLCIICMLFPFLIFTSCQQAATPQITMQQIQDAIEDSENPNIVDADVSDFSFTNEFLTSFGWAMLFERNNVSTEHLTAIDCYTYEVVHDGDSTTYSYTIRVFKFFAPEDAEACKNGYDFGSAYRTKTYGNLLVSAHVLLSDFAFGVIDGIEAE